MTTMCRNLFASSVGKKAVVAVTGAVMVAFLIGHMVGNLQVFEGRGPTTELTKLNQYAALLRKEMALLWVVRLTLLATLFLHVVTAVMVTLDNWRARPVNYVMRRYVETTLASRTMIYGGLAVLAYAAYHVLHLTTGTAHAHMFEHGDVYGNVVRSFRDPIIVIAYLLALLALGLHLYHGITSGAQTLGLSRPAYVRFAKAGGRVLALLLAAGFGMVPVAVWLGIIS